MKRTKVNDSMAPVVVLHHERNFEKEDKRDVDDDKSIDEISGLRMLDNLNIALFFSRAQSKMGEQK